MPFARSAFFFAPWLIAACASAPRTVASAHDCAVTGTPASAYPREDAYAHYGRTGQFDAEPSASGERGLAARAGEPRLGSSETRHSSFGRTGQFPNELTAGRSGSSPAAAEAPCSALEDAYAFHGKTDQFPSAVTVADDEVGRASCQR